MTPTYAANGQHQAHRVQHRGGDRAAVEGVLDAVVATEKAPLIGAHFAQVEGRQGQASCGRRDEREGNRSGAGGSGKVSGVRRGTNRRGGRRPRGLVKNITKTLQMFYFNLCIIQLIMQICFQMPLKERIIVSGLILSMETAISLASVPF